MKIDKKLIGVALAIPIAMSRIFLLLESVPLNIFSEYSCIQFSFCGKTNSFGFCLRFNPTRIRKPFIRIRENYLNFVCQGSSHEQSNNFFYKYHFLIADIFRKKNYLVVGQQRNNSRGSIIDYPSSISNYYNCSYPLQEKTKR